MTRDLSDSSDIARIGAVDDGAGVSVTRVLFNEAPPVEDVLVFDDEADGGCEKGFTSPVNHTMAVPINILEWG